MNKKQIAVAAAFLVGSVAAHAAEYIGAPSAHVQKGQFGVGVEYSKHTFDMDRQDGFNSPTGTQKAKVPYETEFKTTSLKLSYGVGDGTAISVRFGKTDGDTTGQRGPFNNNTQYSATADGDVWGMGIETLIFQRGMWSVGANARYTQYDLDGTSNRNVTTTGTEYVELKSYDVGLGIAYAAMTNLTVYGGVSLQYIQGDSQLFFPAFNNWSSVSSLKAENAHLYVGVRYALPHSFSVGLELQQEGWAASAAFHF